MGRDDPLGRSGEEAAVRYLVRRGWRVLARNWRGGGGELDIVVARRGVIAVCEVKSRGEPAALEEPLTAAQRGRITNAAQAFLASYRGPPPREVRFDLLAVATGGARARVWHRPAAFEASAAVRRGRYTSG